MRPDLDVYLRADTDRSRAHVTIGRRADRLACGRPTPKGFTAMDARTLEADQSVLCGSCEKALTLPGPWLDPDDWVRAPVWVSENCYVGDPLEACRLNELTWRRVVALGKGMRQTRAAIGTVL